MVRKGGRRDPELRLDVSDDHPVRMGRQEQAQYLQPDIGPERREHVRVACGMGRGSLG
jgi:hypothetical protein